MNFLQTLPLIPTPSPDSLKMDLVRDIDALKHLTWSDVVDKLVKVATDFGLKLLAAIAIYIVGRLLIRWLDKLLRRIFAARKVDSSIDTFVRRMLNIIAYIILVMFIVGILGINTTSLLAIFASAGLAVGMALSGTLQNFAGGVIILLLKPFRTGDYIVDGSGNEGTVKEVRLFHTLLLMSDNKILVLPNGALSGSSVKNFNKEKYRRVEWTFGIAYGNDYDTAKATILEFISQDARIRTTPAEPFVALKELAPNSVNLVVRAWTKSGDFWDVYFALNERVYKEFPSRGLSIPFPQLDVHIQK